jgi:enoyl-CoA hydratase
MPDLTPGQARPVTIEQHGPVRLLRINRPQVHNALNAQVLRELGDGVAGAGAGGARAVVITGTGAKAFCAGADLRELSGLGPDAASALLAEGQAVMRAIERSPLPVIAAVNGVALGGGFELALAATFSVLADHATLGLPEAGLGLIPGYGGTQRLARLAGRAVAAHVMLTGTRVDADRAYALGLTPVKPVPAGAVVQEALGLARSVAMQGPRAVQAIRAALDAGLDAPIEAALAAETGLAALALSGAEAAEGIAAFLGKRSPKYAAAVTK